MRLLLGMATRLAYAHAGLATIAVAGTARAYAGTEARTRPMRLRSSFVSQARACRLFQERHLPFRPNFAQLYALA